MSNGAELTDQKAAKPDKQSDSEFFKALGIDLEAGSKPANDLKASKPAKTDGPLSNMPTNLTLLSLTAASVCLGFFGTLAYAKKRDGESLGKSLLPRRGMSESGTKLAFRALGWGTLYAVGGFSVITYGLYQLTKHRLKEFEQRIMDERRTKEAAEQ